MPEQVDVLILTASYGGGHLQAARALAEGFQLTHPDLKCALVNFFKEVSPTANRLVEVSYRHAVLRAPRLWGRFYRLTARANPESRVQRRLTRLFFPKARHLLKVYSPRAVVSTYPVASQVMGELKRRGYTDLPLITILTDQAVHSQWLHPATDLYIAGSQYLKRRMVRCGVPAERVVASGIPISPRFAVPREVEAARRALGLDPQRPVVLIMVGAQGLLPDADELCTTLAASGLPLQVVLVAGHDERLRLKTERAVAGSRQPVRVLGFVTNIEEWMAASDVLVGKAGGLTTAEALARRLPLVIVHPIPGQEEENTRFLVRAGAAVRVDNITAAVSAVEDILQNPAQLEAMRRAAAEIARPDAARDAAQAVAALLR